MYLNHKSYPKELKPQDLYYLLLIKGMEFDTEIPPDSLERFKDLDLTTYIKGKKSDAERLKIRLSEKGKELLIKLSFEGSADEETEKIKDWVISVYKNKNGGIVKNKVELGRRIQWYKTITNIKGNFLALLIQLAMNDTYDPECGQSFYDFKKDNPRAILSNISENLFWMPTSHFDRHYTLDKSPLYTYFEDNKEYVHQVWEHNLDENGNKRINANTKI